MKYIGNIDEAARGPKRGLSGGRYVIAKSHDGFGLLKWRIRIIKVRYVLIGKADAFTYTDQE